MNSAPGATNRQLRVGIIPARLASTRLPQKLLLAETGKPLLVHTWEATCATQLFDRVLVATDSERLAATATASGAEVVMTSVDCQSGGDRVREAADKLGLPDEALIVNVQGDEPEITGASLAGIIAALEAGAAQVATLAYPISPAEAASPNLVKVVIGSGGGALYFSRAAIPFVRDADAAEFASPYLGHAGLYAFRANALRRFSDLPPSPLERLEKLEQLRLLEAGIPIQVVIGDRPGRGIDTRADYEEFSARFLARQKH